MFMLRSTHARSLDLRDAVIRDMNREASGLRTITSAQSDEIGVLQRKLVAANAELAQLRAFKDKITAGSRKANAARAAKAAATKAGENA